MNRDFPFSFAFIAAVLLHASMVLIFRWSPVVASPPSAPPAPQPVVVRFVESPSGAPSMPSKPDTKNFSDANRKAGSLELKKRSADANPPRSPGPLVAPRSAQPRSSAPRAASAARVPSPGSMTPGQVVNQEGTIPVSPQQGAASDVRSGSPSPQLAQSLQNLDQFIRPGSGSRDTNIPQDSGSGVFFDTQGYDLGPWANRIVSIVRSNWLIPLAAQMGNKGVVGVSFKIDRSGKVFDIKIVQSSPVPSFDQAAVNALKSSSPFPPLPADFPRPHLPAVFRFYYNMPVPD